MSLCLPLYLAGLSLVFYFMRLFAQNSEEREKEKESESLFTSKRD